LFRQRCLWLVVLCLSLLRVWVLKLYHWAQWMFLNWWDSRNTTKMFWRGQSSSQPGWEIGEPDVWVLGARGPRCVHRGSEKVLALLIPSQWPCTQASVVSTNQAFLPHCQFPPHSPHLLGDGFTEQMASLSSLTGWFMSSYWPNFRKSTLPSVWFWKVSLWAVFFMVLQQEPWVKSECFCLILDSTY
jgi:hypothetical protein